MKKFLLSEVYIFKPTKGKEIEAKRIAGRLFVVIIYFLCVPISLSFSAPVCMFFMINMNSDWVQEFTNKN